MAKAHKTAMEELFTLVDHSNATDDEILGLIERMRKELFAAEREQLDAAYNAGKSNQYHDAGHYFFMNYIDND